MPYIEWIAEIFPEPQQPFCVAEITRRLHQLYNPRINEGMVHGAIRALNKRPALAQLIAPVDGSRPAYYKAGAARRIARHVTRAMKPERLQMPVQVPASKKTSPSLHLPDTVVATAGEMDLAA